LIGTAALGGLLARPALAAGFPAKDISFIIPFAPGGGFDGYVRAAIPPMMAALPAGSRVIPVNLDGAGGAKAASQVFHARPDGYTISVLNMPGALILQMLQGGGGYDLQKFSWIGNLGGDPYAICVGKDSPIKSVADLQALSRQRVVKFTSTGPASMGHAATLIATRLLDVRAQIISGYKGTSDYLIAAVRGDGDAAISSLTSMTGLAAGGVIRILATFEAKGSIAGVPDAAGIGQPDLAQLVQLRPVAGPPGMKPEIVKILAGALDAALTNPEMLAWAKTSGANIDRATPEETRAMLKTQTAFISKWHDVLAATA
jgi:tripartite-type tricarboxylate transporter receptor subunit TctC